VPARARRDPAAALREAVAAQRALLAEALAATPPDAPLRGGSTVGGLERRLPADADEPDLLLALVVAGLDLPAPVAPDRGALRLVVKALAERLAQTAPGRHVEARVPPYAAVQCVEGPRHTRGTPPNVVEADPVAFVELCTGRLAWADAAADGRVRTWGDRADLSPYLPLP
jgi:hypothetical protein